MAKTLRNFLIGVGLDTEKYDKGAKKVESSLERMRTLVGFTGKAISGAFGAVGLAAIVAANRVDKSMLAWEKFKTPPAWINAYGHAVAQLGGDFEDAAAAISSIEKAQADLKLKGLLGPLEDVALTGGDINALSQTQNGAEFLRTLAPMVQNMNKDQQRLVQETLSLSDGVMRSLRGGVDELDAAVAKAAQLYGEFGKSTEAAREYNRALAELNTRFEGVGETLAKEVLPGFTKILDSFGNFIDDNRDLISKGAEVLGENPTATALVAGGGAAGVAGAALRGTGLRTAGALVSRFGWQGMALGGALIAGDMALDTSNDVVTSKSNPKGRKGDGYDWSDITMSSLLGLGDLTYEDLAASKRSDNPIQKPSYEPVYSGGEIDNVEAANASPAVIMMQDQHRRAEAPAITPRITVQNHLEANLSLDGRQLDTRIIDVVERRERNTMDDITSSVER